MERGRFVLPPLTAALLLAGSFAGAPRRSAAAPPYQPWRGEGYPEPGPLGTLPAREPGPEPREWPRRPGELTIRGSAAVSLGRFASPPAPVPYPQGELVGLVRLAPEVGWGLSATVPRPLGGRALAPAAAPRLAVVLRAFPRDRGAFEPFAELAAGLVRVAGSADAEGPWGAGSRVSGGASWYLSRSWRLGTWLGFATTTFRRRPTGAPATRGVGPLVFAPAVEAGFELTGCFGAPY